MDASHVGFPTAFKNVGHPPAARSQPPRRRPRRCKSTHQTPNHTPLPPTSARRPAPARLLVRNSYVQTPRAQTFPAHPGRNAAPSNPRATHETSTPRPQRLQTNQPSTPSCRSTTPSNTPTTPINPYTTPQLQPTTHEMPPTPLHSSQPGLQPPPSLQTRVPPDGLARRRPPRHQGHEITVNIAKIFAPAAGKNRARGNLITPPL